MSILIQSGEHVAAAQALGARLDQHGIHDWRIASGVPDDGPWICRLMCGPADASTDLADAHVQSISTVLRFIAQHRLPPLLDGVPLALQYAMHGVHNALTPAVICVSMLQANAQPVPADLVLLSDALSAVRSRLGAIDALATGASTTVAVGDLLGFCDRPDSLRRLTADQLTFDLAPAPLAALSPAQLASWIETAAAAPAQICFTLRGQGDQAWLRITASRPHLGLCTIARAAIAAGAEVAWGTNGVALQLPAPTPAAALHGGQVVLVCQPGATRDRFARALRHAGYQVIVGTDPLARSASNAAVFIDAAVRAAWLAPLPPHCLIFHRDAPPTLLDADAMALSHQARPTAICAMAARLQPANAGDG